MLGELAENRDRNGVVDLHRELGAVALGLDVGSPGARHPALAFGDGSAVGHVLDGRALSFERDAHHLERPMKVPADSG